jgi:hypothetical protein
VEKCSVLHCGLHQPCNNYHINTVALASVDSLRDLGVLRSGDARYHAHCSEVVTKASRMCGVIRRVFNSGHRNALWPAFTTYVQPILSYCTPVWSPHLKGDIAAIEAVQRRFTKKIHGLEHMSYSMRLADLGALSLLNRRRYADLLVTFRYVRGLVNGSLSDIGLELSTAPTRGEGIRLSQRRPINSSCANLFAFRAAKAWNNLPSSIITHTSLSAFKRAVFNYLYLQQT